MLEKYSALAPNAMSNIFGREDENPRFKILNSNLSTKYEQFYMKIEAALTVLSKSVSHIPQRFLAKNLSN